MFKKGIQLKPRITVDLFKKGSFLLAKNGFVVFSLSSKYTQFKILDDKNRIHSIVTHRYKNIELYKKQHLYRPYTNVFCEDDDVE
jgi:hypothetical protein